MKTAKELYELSKNKTPEKVKKVLDAECHRTLVTSVMS